MRIFLTVSFSLLLFLVGRATFATSSVIPSFDNFELPYFFEEAQKNITDTTVIFVHGSGPTDADGDFTNLTQPTGTENKVYRDLARVLRDQGYHTLRYHKRSYVISQKLQKDPGYQTRPEFTELQKSPLNTLVKDLMSVIAWTKINRPNDKVILFGHSEGVNLALFALSQKAPVDKLVLSGFSNEPQSFLMLEQMLFRAQRIIFSSLDTNHDFKITQKELNTKNKYAAVIGPQLKTIDNNGDGQIDINEFLAGNYSNLVLNDRLLNRDYLKDELRFKKPSVIVQESTIPITFVTALNDNQTPPYHAQAIELVNKTTWKKSSLSFTYLKGVGHSFGTRGYDTLYFTKPKTETLKKIVNAF